MRATDLNIGNRTNDTLKNLDRPVMKSGGGLRFVQGEVPDTIGVRESIKNGIPVFTSAYNLETGIRRSVANLLLYLKTTWTVTSAVRLTLVIMRATRVDCSVPAT